MLDPPGPPWGAALSGVGESRGGNLTSAEPPRSWHSWSVNDLAPLAAAAGSLLTRLRHTVGVSESSAGGLISAALLAIPGASAYFLGARAIREKLGTTWGLAETGATGPTGNRYGDAAGHACIAVTGPVERVITIETGRGDREANMWAFTRAALDLLTSCLEESAKPH